MLCCSALAASVAALPAFGKVGAANAADEGQGVASSRMSYSRFLEYLDMGRVKKVHMPRYKTNTQAVDDTQLVTLAHMPSCYTCAHCQFLRCNLHLSCSSF